VGDLDDDRNPVQNEFVGTDWVVVWIFCRVGFSGLVSYAPALEALLKWKEAHPEVCVPNVSTFSKVLPHLQRKGIEPLE
jgi:hypothetical protein